MDDFLICIAALLAEFFIAVLSAYLCVIHKKLSDLAGVVGGLAAMIFSYASMQLPPPVIYPLDGRVDAFDQYITVDTGSVLLTAYYTFDSAVNPVVNGKKYMEPIFIDKSETLCVRNSFLFKYSAPVVMEVSTEKPDSLSICFDEPERVSGIVLGENTYIPLDTAKENRVLNQSSYVIEGNGFLVPIHFSRALTEEEIASLTSSVSVDSINSDVPSAKEHLLYLEPSKIGGQWYFALSSISELREGDTFHYRVELCINNITYVDEGTVEWSFTGKYQ